jgi:hypothetical protein
MALSVLSGTSPCWVPAGELHRQDLMQIRRMIEVHFPFEPSSTGSNPRHPPPLLLTSLKLEDIGKVVQAFTAIVSTLKSSLPKRVVKERTRSLRAPKVEVRYIDLKFEA